MGVLLKLPLEGLCCVSRALFWFYFSRRALARGEDAQFSLCYPSRVCGAGSSSLYLILTAFIWSYGLALVDCGWKILGSGVSLPWCDAHHIKQ